jgi:hypothetical protein
VGDELTTTAPSAYSSRPRSTPILQREKVFIPLHPTLVPGSTFDNVEFLGTIPETRALYDDRSDAHQMKVRGENYLVDNKKISPGNAMMRLLFLELYEVEPKVREREKSSYMRAAYFDGEIKISFCL